MAPRLALLGAERRTEAVDATERHRRRFHVELAALRQVGLVVEVLGLEQRRRALARARREDRRVDEQEALGVHEVAERRDDLGADAQDRLLARRAQPQVAVIHQEVDAVLLGRDRVLRGDEHRGQPGDLQLEAARGPGLGLDLAGEGQGRLQGEAIEGGEIRVREPALHQDSLGHTGAVPKDDKTDLAAGAQVRDPTLEGRTPACRPRLLIRRWGAVWHGITKLSG